MRRCLPYIYIAIAFIVVSAIIYFGHYLIFRNPHHIFIFMVGDLAFLPLEVFLVVIVIQRILTRHEKQTIRQKLNMVIGAFFSEVGTDLLQKLLGCFDTRSQIGERLSPRQNWTHADFKAAMDFASSLQDQPHCLNIDLEELRAYLTEKRDFLLRLLGNPNLLEHESFTDLLWATFHLAEELEARASVTSLPESDAAHISNDIRRLYGYLIIEWVAYTEHLQKDYPFLYSLVTRTHPFLEQPTPVVTG